MDAQKLGQFIAERRKELGMTQKQLSEKLHVTDKGNKLPFITRRFMGYGIS